MPPQFEFKIFLADANYVGQEFHRRGTAIDCVFTSPPYLGQRQYGDSPAEVGREGGVQAYAERLARILASLPLGDGPATRDQRVPLDDADAGVVGGIVRRAIKDGLTPY